MERAERALREALVEHAHEAPEVERSLVPRREPVRRRSWSTRVVAPVMAAAVVVVGGYAVVSVVSDGPHDTSSAGAGSEPPGDAAPAAPEPQADSEQSSAPDSVGQQPTAQNNNVQVSTRRIRAADGTIGVVAPANGDRQQLTARLVVRRGCWWLGDGRAVTFPVGTTAAGEGPRLRLPGGDVVSEGDRVTGRASVTGAHGWQLPGRCGAGAQTVVSYASVHLSR